METNMTSYVGDIARIRQILERNLISQEEVEDVVLIVLLERHSAEKQRIDMVLLDLQDFLGKDLTVDHLCEAQREGCKKLQTVGSSIKHSTVTTEPVIDVNLPSTSSHGAKKRRLSVECVESTPQENPCNAAHIDDEIDLFYEKNLHVMGPGLQANLRQLYHRRELEIRKAYQEYLDKKEEKLDRMLQEIEALVAQCEAYTARHTNNALSVLNERAKKLSLLKRQLLERSVFLEIQEKRVRELEMEAKELLEALTAEIEIEQLSADEDTRNGQPDAETTEMELSSDFDWEEGNPPIETVMDQSDGSLASDLFSWSPACTDPCDEFA